MPSQDTLVIVQPTPFCNINCKYCYLPNRNSRNRISGITLKNIFSKVLATELLKDPLTFLWHAGEPLVLPPQFYSSTFDLCNSINNAFEREYGHSFQTNAILIDKEWVKLFKAFKVRIGVSIDGPSFIHDLNRVTRAGKGTHHKVMSGITQLQDNDIPFSVIMVLTRSALPYVDEIFQFFTANSIHNIAFNIDEMEGPHKVSSFEDAEAILAYKVFMERFFILAAAHNPPIYVRELAHMRHHILAWGIQEINNSLNQALHILNIDYNGNFSTFSPELVGIKDERYRDFVMGNINNDSIESILTNATFLRIETEVQAGVAACRTSCDYYNLCGGGDPGNKYFEHGRFDTTETLYCRIHKKALAEVVLNHMEQMSNVQE